jgi:hypothetical protein
VAARNTPLDFLSWHFYSDNAALVPVIADAMRAKVGGESDWLGKVGG